MKEIYDWMNSTDFNKGYQLFRHVESKIISEIANMKRRNKQISEKRRRTLALGQRLNQDLPLAEQVGELTIASSIGNDKSQSGGTWIQRVQSIVSDFVFGKVLSTKAGEGMRSRGLVSTEGDVYGNATFVSEMDHENEVAQFNGDSFKDDKIYVFIASDNDIVKEAFTRYLVGNQHHNSVENGGNNSKIAVMRVKNRGNIAHAKNLNYLRSAGNETGVLDLALDWYLLSMSNHIFAWRRDTDLLSTFAHVSSTNC